MKVKNKSALRNWGDTVLGTVIKWENIKVKVKQSCYRPRVAHRVPGR